MEVEKILTLFVTLLTVIDPFGLVPIYLPIADRFPKELHTRIIARTCLISLVISSGFLLVGRALFYTLGVEVYSIYTAGGILLFAMGLDLVFGSPKKAETEQEGCYGLSESYREVCVYPLSIPVLAGPGTIATLIMFASNEDSIMHYAIVFISLVAVFGIAAITMYFSGWLLKLLGRTGLNVIERVMGIILCALAVQFIANSITLFMQSLPAS